MRRPRDTAQWTFVAIAAALLPLMLLASHQFGVTWDEKSRHRYGEIILEFLRGLRDRSEFLIEDGGQLYGGLFDTICAFVERVVPGDRYVIRHMVNATFGWIGVLYSGRLAARLFNTWTGVLAMVLLVSSPRYFADSMNNPKDLPFAAMTMVTLYYISTISPKWPYVSKGTALKLAIALGIALNIRAGALIYVGYLGLLVMAYVIAERNLDKRQLAITAGALAAVVIGVLLLGTIFWPWAQLAPFTRPVEALIALSNFPWNGDVLFNGMTYSAPDLPWYYPLLWLAISTPPVVLAGAALSAFQSRDRLWQQRTYAVWAVVAFPLLMVIVRDATLYDGIRHLLFIYPTLVVVAAAGWMAWLSRPGAPWVRQAAAIALALGLANVLAFNVRAYPNQTVYFNELVGGPRGAFAKYEMDYWGNSILEAVDWSARAARASGRAFTISGNLEGLVSLDAQRYHELAYIVPWRPHHLDVLLNRGDAESMIALANRKDVLYRVTTYDGVVLCVVAPGPNFGEIQPYFLAPPDGR